MNGTTRIIKCSCKNTYQDKRYGKGKRVANHGVKANNGHSGYRCTVCGMTKAG